MLEFEPCGRTYVAKVHGVDLKKPLSVETRAQLLWGLGKYGVLCIPEQRVKATELTAFCSNFGSLRKSDINAFLVPGSPEVTILSNIVENGRPIGVKDAGQAWHTDMSYLEPLGFLNVLLARQVPFRDGKPLGATIFSDVEAAYEDLPDSIKEKLDGRTAIHFLGKYWEYMRTVKSSPRAPLNERQLQDFPPTSKPVIMRHPLSGKKLIFVNPAYTVKIEGMDEDESESMLSYLYDHILQEKYIYTHEWAEGDLIFWDLIRTWHNATADYTADEPRLLERVQVLADKISDPAFMSATQADYWQAI